MPICPKCKYEFNLYEQRSNPQNKYYWAVIVRMLADHLGYFDIEMHEILKALFLKEQYSIAKKNGEKVQVNSTRSTTSLDTKEFEKYLYDIRIWSDTELSFILPEPNQETIDE